MWNVIQCAVQGRGHISSGTPCQDKTCSINTDSLQIIALADGAGSARLSHYGAEAVTRFICSELADKFDTYFADGDGVAVKRQLLEDLSEELNKTAVQLNCEVSELASTLLFAAVKNERFIIAHIGDGVIGYLRNNELKTASQPENGEFVNTTVFTTSKDALMTMKLIKGALGEIQGFVLMSDGTEASLYNKKERKLADALKRIMQVSAVVPADKVQDQLKQSFEAVVTNATTDDCSIAILVKANSAFKGYLRSDNDQKRKLLEINPRVSERTIQRYDDILVYLQSGRSLHQTARMLRLKPKYAKKYIHKLLRLNFIEKNGNCYQTILIMNTEYTGG